MLTIIAAPTSAFAARYSETIHNFMCGAYRIYLSCETAIAGPDLTEAQR